LTFIGTRPIIKIVKIKQFTRLRGGVITENERIGFDELEEDLLMLIFYHGKEKFRITEDLVNTVTYTVEGIGFEQEDDEVVVGSDMYDYMILKNTFLSCFNLIQIVCITRYRDENRLPCCYELHVTEGHVSIEVL
jgi:hypothetical protein